MSVAPVAVEIGPRNRRRLTKGAIVVGVIGAIAAGLLLTRPSGQPGSLASTRPARQAASSDRLVYGMTKQQVRRLTGRPAAVSGNCLLFQPTKTGMVGSISVQPSFATMAYDPRTSGSLKLCFVGGGYSYGSQRFFDKRHHRWVWGGWPMKLGNTQPAP